MHGKSIKFTPYDLKSKAAKYKRWSPKMDQFLIKLLSDVVHSYAKEERPQLNKKAWAYICNQLRIANPETVYATYTKYSCQQHLIHVIHNRYKLWYTLMLHSKNADPNVGYSFKWNPNLGSFQIIVTADNTVITDESIIKSIIYGESLPLPSVEKFPKGNVVVNDFFLSDNFSYMSDYHNEVLPMLIDSDPSYMEGFGSIYNDIPKFKYEGFNTDYQKPLQMIRAKRTPDKYNGSSSIPASDNSSTSHNHTHPNSYQQLVSQSHNQHHGHGHTASNQVPDLSSHDVSMEKRSLHGDFEGDLSSTGIAEFHSPQGVPGANDPQTYQKDRPWFTKLMALHESNLITINDFFTVLEGVRDSRFPLPLLNILDPGAGESKLSDREIAKRTKMYIIPRCESFKH
ncbi:hypothetical protein CANTEDRAFT_100642 [Yamadazyma tenuis ATCC 10573]|uniref:Myb/SANT-like domain-containing protein n=1 Tax=Candida tenuis (strain ATCC 10573 / BCRC 21748 / CBS 615 / JCM 9827 / NBRC 10315 / NRRL Y-1498 / VKM Y-70) TaxID=590646 RepID=G3AXD5_CANTC|nr:uncharacterized protein CANTEDRAFT_100642 [Yamadazyma tenuis ATCC 10573]EGV66346.1 hypothetical protein CANTEDRAFT_100642 [Yamadazyma tenuis ATCC 10573]